MYLHVPYNETNTYILYRKQYKKTQLVYPTQVVISEELKDFIFINR